MRTKMALEDNRARYRLRQRTVDRRPGRGAGRVGPGARRLNHCKAAEQRRTPRMAGTVAMTDPEKPQVRQACLLR